METIAIACRPGVYQLREEELKKVNGGGGLEFIVGVAVGWLIDGVVEAVTGKSPASHVADAIKVIFTPEEKNYDPDPVVNIMNNPNIGASL
jgi:hypothetical protein